jgi:hypothetical protein
LTPQTHPGFAPGAPQAWSPVAHGSITRFADILCKT